MFRRPFKVECTLLSEDYVGVLPHLSSWVTKCRLVPGRGDTVPLPATVRVARPKNGDPSGRDPEVLKMDLRDRTGVITSVFYLPTRDLVKVGVEEAHRAGEN